MPETTLDLASRLRQDTTPQHAAAERQEFQRRMVSGRLTLPAYSAWLNQMLIVHDTLERQLAALPHDAFGAPDHSIPIRPKVQHLRDDLAFIGTPASGTPPAACVQAFCDALQAWSADSPHRLVGPHYVLEGSTNGGRFIAPRVRVALGFVDERGTSYLDPYGAAQGEQWAAYRQWLNSLALAPSAIDDIVVAAQATFTLVGDLGDTLIREHP